MIYRCFSWICSFKNKDLQKNELNQSLSIAQQDLNAELEKTIQLKKDAGLEEKIEDDDDKDAVKGAMKARGKFEKLDLAVKGLKKISREMEKLGREYSKADEAGKEKIKDFLKVKTPKKRELEALVAKLEKDVV